MKKLLSLSLVACFVLAMAVGCGGGSTPTKKDGAATPAKDAGEKKDAAEKDKEAPK